MPSSVEATSRDRDCLLGMLAEPAYPYRCQHPGYGITTVVSLVDREEGGPARLRDAASGVPCSALFTRAELQRRLEEQRAAAR